MSGHGGNGEIFLGEQLPSGLAGALLELWLRTLESSEANCYLPSHQLYHAVDFHRSSLIHLYGTVVPDRIVSFSG